MKRDWCDVVDVDDVIGTIKRGSGGRGEEGFRDKRYRLGWLAAEFLPVHFGVAFLVVFLVAFPVVFPVVFPVASLVDL